MRDRSCPVRDKSKSSEILDFPHNPGRLATLVGCSQYTTCIHPIYIRHSYELMHSPQLFQNSSKARMTKSCCGNTRDLRKPDAVQSFHQMQACLIVLRVMRHNTNSRTVIQKTKYNTCVTVCVFSNTHTHTHTHVVLAQSQLIVSFVLLLVLVLVLVLVIVIHQWAKCSGQAKQRKGR